VVGAKAGIDRLVTDIVLGRRGSEERLETWLKENRRGASDDRLTGYQILCGAYLREQRFRDGVRVCTAAETIEKGSASNVLGLHQAFATVGPAHWSAHSVEIALRDGQIAQARRNGAHVEALFDTGAEIGIVSASTAAALQARPIDGAVSMGTTTTPVSGSLVAIDSVELGNARLENLTAVVLSDEQAAYAELELVIPLPAMLTLGRFAYVDHGRRLLLGDAVPRPAGARTRLYWDESGIGFAARFSGGNRSVHFDSGSRRTWLFPAALAALSPNERATRRSIKRTIGGVGGERAEDGWSLRDVTISVAGGPWTFAEIEMAEKDENGEAARIGTGLFDRFSTVLFDIRSMRMTVWN
jgi:hypothetical protein